MHFEFRCLNCDEILRADIRFIGRMSRCPRCHNRLIVPELGAENVLKVYRKPTEELAPEEPAPPPPTEDTRPVLLITEDLLEPRNVREAINAFLRWRVKEALRSIPMWGISIGLHAVVILAFTTIGYLSLSTQQVVKRIHIPLKSSVIIADLPKKMEDLTIHRDATPDFDDILRHVEPAQAVDGTGDDPFLRPGGSGDGPPVIGLEDPLGKVMAASTGRGIGPLGPGGTGSKVGYHGFEVGGARSVVFIVDTSGSMLAGEPGKTRWDVAVKELRQSIAKLSFGHLFNLYFARVIPGDSTFYKRWRDGLVLANPANKEECFLFIDEQDREMQEMREKALRGQLAFGPGTDIVQAVADALKSSPDVIFLLSDAEFRELIATGHNPADEIRALNRIRGARIYTICFKERSGERIMKRIADENKGRYKFIP